MHNRPHRLLLAVHRQVGLGGRLVRIIHAGEADNLAGAGPLVDAPPVRPLAVLERRGHVHEEEGPAAGPLDQLARLLAGVLEGRDGRRDDGGAGLGQLRRHEGDAADVGVAVLAREPQARRELVADRLAQQHRDGAAPALQERDLERARDLVLARVLVARQEDGEALGRRERVLVAQDLDDLGIREPGRDLAPGPEPVPQLGARDVEGARALGDFVGGHVLALVREIRHLLEGHHLDAELLVVLHDGVLGVVGPVEVLAVLVLAGAGVVAADDEVGGAVVAADNGVPDCLAGAAHAHGQGQERELGHAVGVAREEGLVHPDSGEVVDVAGLGETHHGVNQDVSLLGAGGTDRELAVGAVHGVAGLEGHDAFPPELVEEGSQLGGGIYGKISEKHKPETAFRWYFGMELTPKLEEIVVFQSVHGLELSADVELLCRVEEELDTRVCIVVASKYFLCLYRPLSLLVVSQSIPSNRVWARNPYLFGLYTSSTVKMARFCSSRKSRSVILAPSLIPSSSIVAWLTSSVMGMLNRTPLVRR